MKTVEQFIEDTMSRTTSRNLYEVEFHQAVHEVVESLAPFLLKNPRYLKKKVLERMIEPERIVSFRVPWTDDLGEVFINRGFRIEMNSAIGPYKGGLRFHPTVNQSILKFLAFEQVFKNSLTGLPLGGGKGGSDFDPKEKSDDEVMRFCQSFMMELCKHIGPNTDIPAGDIGVGGREIGYMFGLYKRIRNEFTGVLTGKAKEWGGSLIRPEATGYGNVYFASEMLGHIGQDFNNKTVAISGSGNVALFTAEKILEMGGKVVTLSDSDGSIYDPGGVTKEKLAFIQDLKNTRRGRIKEYAEEYRGVEYLGGHRPWGVPCDIALPSATQNEIEEHDAVRLVANGCKLVSEGANMPCSPEAIALFQEKGVLYAPGKASNAGGVAVSGLEMAQNSMRLHWSRDEVNSKLKGIMKSIHATCLQFGRERGETVNYVNGANIGGFVKVADAMLAQGLV